MKENSPAIGAADSGVSPETDFRGFLRDAQPDLGAMEYGALSSIKNVKSNRESSSCIPQPFDEKIRIKNQQLDKDEITIYSLLGQDYTPLVSVKIGEETEIDTSRLPKGVYFLFSTNAAATIIKQ